MPAEVPATGVSTFESMPARRQVAKIFIIRNAHELSQQAVMKYRSVAALLPRCSNARARERMLPRHHVAYSSSAASAYIAVPRWRRAGEFARGTNLHITRRDQI